MICEIDFPGADGERWQLRFEHPHRVLVAHQAAEVVDVVAQAEQAARDGHWVVGFVAYEAAAAFDAALLVKAPSSRLPLAAFGIYGAETAPHVAPQDAFCCGPWRSDTSREAMRDGVDAIRRRIAAGDYYQINYTQRLTADMRGDAFALYAALRAAQPGGYNAFIDGGDWQIASVSPELFFEWTPDGVLTTRPMKGTAPPSANGAARLRESPKDQAENLMIVDLLRNDLAHVAVTGSVEVDQLFAVEALPTALQMTSTVRCRTRPETTLVDIFRALFPCGSVTGAPKVAAMHAIARLEAAARGAYCGAVGVMHPNGHATFNVAIRTVSIDAGAGVATCGIGSGIVYDSTADDEYEEWLVKRRFLLRATACFELLETLLLDNGRYWLLDGHLDRLAASAEHFGFPCDAAQVRRQLGQHAREHAQGRWRVRLLLRRDGRVAIETHALLDEPEPLRVVLAQAPVADSEFLRHKTTQRDVYAMHAPRDGSFDTLMFNARGEITEFTRGNVVVELDGQRVTPPLQCGLLPGVLRAELLRQGGVVERVVTRDDLARATGLWFINSVRGERRVTL